MSEVSNQISIKAVLLGSTFVGKTAIFHRLKNEVYTDPNPTIQADHCKLNVIKKNKNYGILLFDTAGQERFQSITPGYCRGADLVILVFSLIDQISFDDCKNRWKTLINNNCPRDPFIILVANKSDCATNISDEDIESLKKELNANVAIKTSAINGDNIDELRSLMAIDNTIIDGLPPKSDNNDDPGKCC